MTNQAKSLQQTAEHYLTILNGPESGVAYKVVGQKLTIGRSKENDIVLHDTKSSRRHVMVELQSDGKYKVVDLGSQNGIFHNGVHTKECVLNLGDRIAIGETELAFDITPVNHLPATKEQAIPPLTQSTHKYVATPLGGLSGLPHLPHTTYQNKRNVWILAVVAIAIIGIVYFQSTNQKRAQKKFELGTEEATTERIQKMDQENELLLTEIQGKGKDTPQYEEAQSFYLRGFRDFREGNYSRAIQNFETSLTLYPQHQLAGRYLARSRQKLSEQMAEAFERGEKAYGLQKFSIALNEFRTVLLLSGDPKNKTYQQAKSRIETIRLIKRSRQ